ncbi:hypothetical protein [uncultured Rothia sp.]|jgi:glutathione S-transferase|uniref:hypothetical protein n=1 Tax=uncultured Rothia sp. TaxID=316088 RepID=UPI002637A254|nr:hypothetical protein [uncultured Rothia sp.]
MAEELPQNSSGSQVASKDSGVIAGVQSSNSTGKSATVQSNQNSQAPTTQNNQNNKKYDLGVLFIHGIGIQKPGDTFKEMYKPLKEEIVENKEILFVELNKSITKAECAVVTKGPQSQNKRANVIFRESNWNGLGGGSSTPTGRWEYLIGALKAILYIVHALGNAILFGGLRVILGITLGLYAIKHITEIYEFLRVFMYIGYFLVGALIICIIFLVWKYFDVVLKVFNLFKSRKVLVFLKDKIYLLVIWYQQINNVVTYGYTQKANGYIQQITDDICKIQSESKKVMIVAHSMGGFLSFEVLKSLISIPPNTIYFNGVGSGIGPVKVLRSGPLERLNLATKNTPCVNKHIVWIWFSVSAIFWALLSVLYIHAIYDICVCTVTVLRGEIIDFPIFSLLVITLVFAIRITLLLLRKKTDDFLKNVSRKEYVHFLDFVGNSATHTYGNYVELYRFMSSGDWYKIHVLPAYFNKHSILLKSICDDILDILFEIPGRRPVYREVKNLRTRLNILLFAAVSILSGVLLCLSQSGCANLDFRKYILFSIPSFIIMATFGFLINEHFGTWFGHATWDKDSDDPDRKYAKEWHMQIFTFLISLLYVFFGYLLWNAYGSM